MYVTNILIPDENVVIDFMTTLIVNMQNGSLFHWIGEIQC